ncbi:DNA translocase FtsK [Brevibacillus antibioticus]|uniref:DNA translocase FtsK n=1 Tax=Brevibacillus antibioticus TaxID=2570228 RepID=A0A4U2Y3T3_9BACL|nr:DNA translocase FtsK [Brevibacillus antibioticus]TKI54302.1 DNA translocase FtsK [Brevibacillus antibioticus]
MWSWLQKLMNFFQGEREEEVEEEGRPAGTSNPTGIPAPRQPQAKTKNIYPKERVNNRDIEDNVRQRRERQFRFPVVPDDYLDKKRNHSVNPAESNERSRQQVPRERFEPKRESVRPVTERVLETKTEPVFEKKKPELVKNNSEIPQRPNRVPQKEAEKVTRPVFSTEEKRAYQPSEIVSPVYGKITPATREAEHRIHTTAGIIYPRLEQEEHLQQMKQWEQEISERYFPEEQESASFEQNEPKHVVVDESVHNEGKETASESAVETALDSEREVAASLQMEETVTEEIAGKIIDTESESQATDLQDSDSDAFEPTVEETVALENEEEEVQAEEIELADSMGSENSEEEVSESMGQPEPTDYSQTMEERLAHEEAEHRLITTLSAVVQVESENDGDNVESPSVGEENQEVETKLESEGVEAPAYASAISRLLERAEVDSSEVLSSAEVGSVSEDTPEQPEQPEPTEPTEPESIAQQIVEPIVEPVAPIVEPVAESVAETVPVPAPSAAQPVNMSQASMTNQPASAPVIDSSNEADHGAESAQPPYALPDLGLLNPSPPVSDDDDEHTQIQKLLLEETLANFNVSAQVVGIVKGPSVTRFELQPAPGVKVNKITGLIDDIKLNLAAKDIRIEAPIPGRNAIGIEVPNMSSQPVLIEKIISSDKFQEHSSPLAVALGMDIGGEPIIADIKKMPHGLIAGSTGSGKSVCINSIIVSLLYKATPEQVRLLLIDPKMVELAPYNHLPHLITPVVTEAKQATASLKWAVEEMEKRYALFVDAGVRDIDRYNQTTDDQLPYIVIIIDELADLMMVSPQDVEDCIIRIAQKARACGIHLLLATQRPSVDVITGNIKANVPTRLAFAVFSQVDSRTILDQSGAERLLGRGDMLFLESGTTPVRLQGNFVSDDEIERITHMIKKQRKPAYIFSKEDLEQQVASFDSGDDPLYLEALVFVADQGQASASGLQRRFRVGYNRAARLIEMMEADGYVAGQSGGKARAVLISKEDAQAVVEGSSSLL